MLICRMEGFKLRTIMLIFMKGKKYIDVTVFTIFFRYNADIKYVGTASYPHEHRHQSYNAPKFIPVHLKSKPSTPTHKSRPKKPQRNLYKAHSPPSRSRYTNSQYRRKPTLQPELKSIENIEIDIIEHSF